jgi:hypothetical protein
VGNSSMQLQELVDDAQSFAELAPSLATGGRSDLPGISIANDVMQAMVAGGPEGQPFNWKWNRSIETPFFLNGYQQDYFIPNLVNLGWLESCTSTNFSSTAPRKPVRQVEVKRDLEVSNMRNTQIGKICWMQNNTMLAGTWGQSAPNSATGIPNPGVGAVYVDPSTQSSTPPNPVTGIKDAFNNLWVVTTYGTCGGSNPFSSNLNPVFPTLQLPTTVATTANDGTVVWTAVNPEGRGYRVSPPPGSSAPVWQIAPVGQNRVARLKNLGDFLNPIPDDYYSFFKQGFFAQCYRRSPDVKVRAKFEGEFKLWMLSLKNAIAMGAREQDDWGFFPGEAIMETGYSYAPDPSRPYGPWGN